MKIPDSITAYFSFRDELSVCNSIILKGHNRIAIPESLRPQANQHFAQQSTSRSY